MVRFVGFGGQLPPESPVSFGPIRGQHGPEYAPRTKAELLAQWDDDTAELDRIWPAIPPHRYQEVETAFGRWTGTGIWMILYAIDNEVHHRGQGYVYLRALGIAPPSFFDRG